MNWDQIERKWSAMTRRVRVDWGGETGKEQQATGSGREIAAVGIVMLQETRPEPVMPKRTVRM